MEPDSSLVGKDLRGQNLEGADLAGKVLFGVDLREASLYGAKISLLCQTFDGVKLSNNQVAYLLMLIAQADIDPQFQQGLNDLTRTIVGERLHGYILKVLRIA